MVRELGILRHAIGDLRLSPTQCHMLIELGLAEELTAGELARRLQLDKSTTSRAVNPMIQSGLLSARSDPADRRRKQLSLAAPGAEALRRLDDFADRQVQGALALLRPAQREAVIQGLGLYADALRRARAREALILRAIAPDDDVGVARVIRTVLTDFGLTGPGQPVHDAELSSMYTAYTAPGHAYFVVEAGDGSQRVLGGAGIGPLRGGPADTCELRKMYLLPATRGLGAGHALLQQCLQAAREHGYRRCYLETVMILERARALYERAGFVRRQGPLGDTGHFASEAWYELAL